MPTRRVFLKQASLAGAAAFIHPTNWFFADQLIGIQLYTLREEANKDIKGTIAKIAQVGYNSVEIFNYKDGKYFGLSPEDFAAIFKENNLRTPSGHYSMPNYLLKGDEDELKRTVGDSVKMSHDFFTIPYLTDNMRTSLDDYKRLADRLNKAAEVVK